jgi:hypothetical protein
MLRGINISLTPQPRSPIKGEGEWNWFLFPLSPFGRGARGEGLATFLTYSQDILARFYNNKLPNAYTADGCDLGSLSCCT